MKKIYLLTLFVISLFIVNIKVYAASASLDVSSGSVYVGDTFTVSVNMNSAAAWNIHVNSSGPVSNCIINDANATDDAMDTNKIFSATCTATGEGTITLTLSGDVTSAEDGNAVVSISGSKTVTVTAKPEPDPTPTDPTGGDDNNNNNNNNNDNSGSNNNNGGSNNTDNGSNNTSNSGTTTKPNTSDTTEKKSTNNKIKELSVDGFKLEKKDDNNYVLTVPADTESINIKATAEDSKAKVEGAGKHDIKVGENNVEIIVTSESGEKNKINIKVTRKEKNTIEDLESALKNNKSSEINIDLENNTKISKQDIEKVKNSKKRVNFNTYNDKEKLLYSWILDGSKIKDANDLLTTIEFNSDNREEILKLSNNADGLFISVKERNNIPKGTRIKLYVGDKFKDKDLVNVYGYVKNNNKLELVKDKLKVTNGYIEFEPGNYTDYFVTMTTLAETDNTVTTIGKKTNLLPIILGAVGALLIIGIIIFIIIKKKNDNDRNHRNDNHAITDDVDDMDNIIRINDI